MDSKVYYIWLAQCFGAGSPHPITLLDTFGSAEAVYNGVEAEYISAGIPEGKGLKSLCDKRLDEANGILDFCRRKNVYVLTMESGDYPQSFRLLQNPPVVLYTMGKMIDFNDNVCITAVGTRDCTAEGTTAAYSFGFRIAECGGVVVSGLAAGIDSAALRGALDASGLAVGIIGCGIDRIYPASNAELFGRMYQCGLVMTEFAPYTRPLAGNFPTRNRLLAAISLGTLVVEGNKNSGALITADYASEYGKRIYAVPGGITKEASEGPNYLIKVGAKAVTDAYEILDDYLYLYQHRIAIKSPPTRFIVPFDLVLDGKTLPKRDIKPSRNIVLEPEMYAVDKITLNSYEKCKEQNTENKETKPKKAKPKASPDAEKKVEQAPMPEAKPEEKPKSTIPEDIEKMLSPLDKQILSLVEENVSNCDDLVRRTEQGISAVLSSMTLLEALGLITQDAGGRLSRIYSE